MPKISNKVEISADTLSAAKIITLSEIHPKNYPAHEREMFKTTKTYTVSTKTRLDQIFVNGLPINAFIDKGRCAIGGTYLEIMNKQRCSIIVVPNISILLSKQGAHPEIDIVYGNVNEVAVEELLKQHKPTHKIMTTPEGMWKIIKGAEQAGRLTEVYSEWFLLLDESHTFISEHYREDILIPFLYFWKFTKKAIISATPFMFSDERYHDLTLHKITFDTTLATIRLVNANSPDAVLNHILKNLNPFPGNLHIFYNSVRAIRDAILRAGIPQNLVSIYCANDEDGTNLKNLGSLAECYVAQPKTGEYNKVNFYTTRYFEGWDLYDKDATMILVTDINKPHTVVGVGSKGKQAIGRLRDEPAELMHITNHKYLKAMKPLEAFRSEFLQSATISIKLNNDIIEEHNKQGLKGEKPEHLTKYADIDKETFKTTLNYMKLDQQVNEAANNEIYNHIDYIEQDWKEAYYDVETEYSDLKMDTETAIKRKSSAKQLEEDYQALMKSSSAQPSNGIFNLNDTIHATIKKSNPTAYDAWKYLNETMMIAFKYNVKKVRSAVILKENTAAEVKLLKLLKETFTVATFYTNEEIKNKLQVIYNRLNLRDENGKIRVAKASEIKNKGWFDVAFTKKKRSKQVEENGMIIIRPQFELRMAA